MIDVFGKVHLGYLVVETERQVAWLRDHGSEEGQGHFLPSGLRNQKSLLMRILGLRQSGS